MKFFRDRSSLQLTSNVFKRTSIHYLTGLLIIFIHLTCQSLFLWVFITNSIHHTMHGLESSSCKDLGIIFTNMLSWWDHYEMISSKAYKSLGLLHRVFKNSECSQVRKSLYITLVWSKLLYCSALWKSYLFKDIELLEKMQCRTTKFILSDYRTRLVYCH